MPDDVKHSPLPWKCSPSIPDRGFEAQVWTADGRALLFFADDCCVGPEADANAALIVRACNAHADLLAACEEAKVYVALGAANSVKTTAEGRNRAGEVLSRLLAAIAKAKGGAA